jgi:hypothetical protein
VQIQIRLWKSSYRTSEQAATLLIAIFQNSNSQCSIEAFIIYLPLYQAQMAEQSEQSKWLWNRLQWGLLLSKHREAIGWSSPTCPNQVWELLKNIILCVLYFLVLILWDKLMSKKLISQWWDFFDLTICQVSSAKKSTDPL